MPMSSVASDICHCPRVETRLTAAVASKPEANVLREGDPVRALFPSDWWKCFPSWVDGNAVDALQTPVVAIRR
jgi:hypothetical protein